MQLLTSDTALASSGVTYDDVIAAGFTDAAVDAGIAGVPTCCQAADLLNPTFTVFPRIGRSRVQLHR
jgi:hypothetical protein